MSHSFTILSLQSKVAELTRRVSLLESALSERTDLSRNSSAATQDTVVSVAGKPAVGTLKYLWEVQEWRKRAKELEDQCRTILDDSYGAAMSLNDWDGYAWEKKLCGALVLLIIHWHKIYSPAKTSRSAKDWSRIVLNDIWKLKHYQFYDDYSAINTGKRRWQYHMLGCLSPLLSNPYLTPPESCTEPLARLPLVFLVGYCDRKGYLSRNDRKPYILESWMREWAEPSLEVTHLASKLKITCLLDKTP